MDALDRIKKKKEYDDINIITKADRKKFRDTDRNVLQTARSLYRNPEMTKKELLEKYRNMDEDEKRMLRVFVRRLP